MVAGDSVEATGGGGGKWVHPGAAGPPVSGGLRALPSQGAAWQVVTGQTLPRCAFVISPCPRLWVGPPVLGARRRAASLSDMGPLPAPPPPGGRHKVAPRGWDRGVQRSRSSCRLSRAAVSPQSPRVQLQFGKAQDGWIRELFVPVVTAPRGVAPTAVSHNASSCPHCRMLLSTAMGHPSEEHPTEEKPLSLNTKKWPRRATRPGGTRTAERRALSPRQGGGCQPLASVGHILQPYRQHIFPVGQNSAQETSLGIPACVTAPSRARPRAHHTLIPGPHTELGRTRQKRDAGQAETTYGHFGLWLPERPSCRQNG